MKPIIKETLAQKQGKDKVLYFLYAYKEILSGALIALIAIGLFLGSLLTRQEVIFRSKVLTEQGADNWLAADLTTTYEELLQPSEKERVLVDTANLDDSQSAEVIGTQLAAKEIDIIWINEKLEDEFVQRYDQDNLTESNLQFTKKGDTFVARIMPNAPHKQALEKVSELYE